MTCHHPDIKGKPIEIIIVIIIIIIFMSGFSLTHMLQGEVVQQHIPGMLYADDIVLLAYNKRDMQRLINIRGQEATDLGLNFSAEKPGIVVFNDATTDVVSIQQGELPRVKEYKYLGVWVNEGDNYLSTSEKTALKRQDKKGHRTTTQEHGYRSTVSAVVLCPFLSCLFSAVFSLVIMNQPAQMRTLLQLLKYSRGAT